MRTLLRILPLAALPCMGACAPGAYRVQVKGRVVDIQENPIRDATVALAIYRECGRAGTTARKVEQVVHTRTGQDGGFSLDARSVGKILHQCYEPDVWLVSKGLVVCKDGKWLRRRGREVTTTKDVIFGRMFDVRDGLPDELEALPEDARDGCVGASSRR